MQTLRGNAHPVRIVRAAALALAAIHPAFAVEPAAALPPPAAQRTDEGLPVLGGWFDANPDLKSTRSSGWNPYNRMLWFSSTRPTLSGESPGRIRANVVETARARAAESAGRAVGWFSIGPTEFSGRIVAVDHDPADPRIVYVGAASGGLWKSTDGGETWAEKTDQLPTTTAGAVCVLQAAPHVVLLGTGEGSGATYHPSSTSNLGIGLLRSTDAGESWSTTSLSYPASGFSGFNVIEENPITGTILAGTNDGLWRSTDQGLQWTQVQSGANYFDVKWKPGDANRVYVTRCRDPFFNFPLNAGVRVSTNDGLTFSAAGTGQPTGSSIGKTKLAVTPANPSVIYAHYVRSTNWQTRGIYRSTDDGATWQVRNDTINMTGGQGWYNLVLAADPDDADRIVTGGVLLYVSSDGGATYQDLNAGVAFGNDTIPHWDNHALAYEPGSSDALWVATDGGVWRSTDDGETWATRRAGIVSYQYYDICVAQSDPQFAMGGTQDNGIPVRSGTGWLHSTFVADGMVCNVNPTSTDRVYAEWQFGNQIKSVNGGLTWASIQNGLAPNGGEWVTPVDEDQNTPNRLFLGHNTGIFRTTNGGNLWQNVAPHHARWISISAADGDVVWSVSPSASVRLTTDGGSTWAPSTGFPAIGLETKIAAHPADAAAAFVTVGGYGTGAPHLLRTTDFGASWADVTGDFPDQPANTLAIDPSEPEAWYLGSDVGVWTSTDAGAHWIPFGAGLPNVVVTDLEIRRAARKLVAGTFGRGVWESELPAPPTAAGEGAALAASSRLMLDPPTPNPTSGRVHFRFAARASGALRLDLYDVGGRRVGGIAEAAADGIIRTAAWQTDDLAAGVYFAVLEAGSERVSRRVVVAR